ncbi:MAG: sulfide/dihydroorotate dehydrogenase-like FAD/NAD-binding protein [Deltaproteobacteria bacterium]|nr:sulfide/dihydroorotate dehydrogenase-like FAD/NAD-binding protein [Deltaproteobacteria bacterium]
MNRIVNNTQLSENVFRMIINAPLIAAKRKAGQFVVIMTEEKGERVPLTIVDSDIDAGTVTIIFQVVGKTTMCLAAMKEGEDLFAVLGPLGTPTEMENFGTAVVVGGGVGIGVAYPIIKALKEAGNKVIAIIGARTKDILILEDEIQKTCDKLIVSTDDGSHGVHGFVTNVLQDLIDSGEVVNRVYAIGPVIMMKFLCEVTRPYKIKTIVSLNPIMVDATGMCGACRVAVGGETKFACVDGPEFDGHGVDFDLLMNRLRMYNDEEEEARKGCRCHE